MRKNFLVVALALASALLIWQCSSGGGSPSDGGTPSDGGYHADGGNPVDGGKPADAGKQDDGGVKPDDGGGKSDTGSGDYDGSVGPDGGKVVLLKFGVFGDSRPPHHNKPGDKAFYDAVSNIIRGMKDKGVHFILGSGDWMFCEPGSDGGAECPAIDIKALLAAEGDGGYGGTIFHIMGNHECDTQDDILCPNENESENVKAYMSLMVKPAGRDHSWFDFNVDTSLGAAHFIVGSPSAMPYPPNDAGGYDGAFTGPQAEWLKTAAAVDASYTFYLQHQPQDDSGGEEGKCIGAGPLYDYMKATNPNVTAYFYGHVHFYKHLKKDPKGNDIANEAIVGNGGATANVCVGDAGTADCRTEDGGQQLCGCSMAVGYAVVTQLPDGNIDVSVYQAEGKGNDPLIDRWKVTPTGKPAN